MMFKLVVTVLLVTLTWSEGAVQKRWFHRGHRWHRQHHYSRYPGAPSSNQPPPPPQPPTFNLPPPLPLPPNQPPPPPSPPPPSQDDCPERAQACSGVSDTVADRIADVVAANDRNGDGTITNFEQIQDVVNTDPNNDGCWSYEEWLQYREDSGFSREYMEYYFQFIQFPVPPDCTAFSVAGLLTPRTGPADRMANNHFQALVEFCEADQTRYTSTCDCAQLPAACQDPRFSALDACVNYTPTIANRQGCIFN